jgi:hypothetical protein
MAELIEGVVHMPSPVRFKHHGKPHACLISWLGVYSANTAGVEFASSPSVRLDEANEPQPDVVMFIEPSRGGRVHISKDDYLEGGPEFAAEVSASTTKLDRGAKRRVYQKHGIREYLVWRVKSKAIDWFELRKGQYQRLPVTPAGHFHSHVFPGLWLDPKALTRLDLPAVLQVLQQGLVDPAHAAFVEKLKTARGAKRR